MSKKDSLIVVAGGQFGSEAKGHVAIRLVDRGMGKGRDVLNVRVAGPNAGHSVVDNLGRKVAFRTLPVGTVRPGVRLAIAAGSEIDPQVLVTELELAKDHGYEIAGRLTVDPEATLIDRHHHTSEESMVGRIGSTGKGIGAARADRLLRKAKRISDEPVWVKRLSEFGVELASFDPHSSEYATDVIVEGTQGYGLGLRAGYYPYCTSSDTRAIDFLAMAGLSPWDYDFDGKPEIWLAIRPYPIRVAGNSGPLFDETTWERLGLPEEYTTVTNKVRRVGRWDGDLVRRAVAANGGTPAVRLAFTMLDQVKPEWAGLGLDERKVVSNLHAINGFLEQFELDAGAPIRMATTSDRTGFFL